MPEREKPVRKDSHGTFVGNAEDLSKINATLLRIQATATTASATQPPKSSSGGASGQTGIKK